MIPTARLSRRPILLSQTPWLLPLAMGLALAVGPGPAAADFPLVAAGRVAPLVADPVQARDPDLAGAIADFQDWVAAACSVKPELMSSPPAADRPAILLGKAAQTAGLEAGEAAVGPDGYVIRVDDRAVRIAGPTPAAVAHGLYDLASTALGVQVHGTGPDDVSVPSRTTVRLAKSERRERPAFILRQGWYNENVLAGYPTSEREAIKRFGRRHRAGGVRAIIRHYFFEMVPPDKYFASHPEYFSEVNGKRVPDGQICTSNPEVIQIAIKYWRDMFDREPDLKIGSLSPNDGERFCNCELCRAQGADLTARIMRFMNEVTRQVTVDHPDRLLSFYAYASLVEPPVDRGRKLHANLLPIVARYSVCQVHPIDAPRCRSELNFARQLDGWTSIARQIMAREYACLWPLPDVTYDVMAEDLNLYRAKGAIGVSREYLYRGFLSDVLMATDLELMWNPTANADSVWSSLLTARFQDSAPAVIAVAADLESQVRALPPEAVVTGDVNSMSTLYTPTVLKNGVEKLKQAMPGASGVVQKRLTIEADRLELARLTLESILESNRYKLSGKDADRSTAEAKLGSANELATKLLSTQLIGANGQGDLQARKTALTAAGLKAPFPPGDFTYEDDMNRGGFARRDSDQLVGFYPGTYGLALNPGQQGQVIYTLSAQPGHHFTSVEIRKLIFKGNMTSMEIKVRGKVFAIGGGSRLDDRDRIYDLTPYLSGVDRFSITFSSRNSTDAAVLALDHWSVQGHVD
jgi:hypothetical protein